MKQKLISLLLLTLVIVGFIIDNSIIIGITGIVLTICFLVFLFILIPLFQIAVQKKDIEESLNVTEEFAKFHPNNKDILKLKQDVQELNKIKIHATPFYINHGIIFGVACYYESKIAILSALVICVFYIMQALIKEILSWFTQREELLSTANEKNI